MAECIMVRIEYILKKNQDFWKLDFIVILFTSIIIFIGFWKISNIAIILILITLSSLFSKYYFEKNNIKITRLDIFIPVYVAVELLSYYSSYFRINSIYFIIKILCFLLFYFFIKHNITTSKLKNSIFIVLTVLGIILSFLTLIHFSFHQFTLDKYGFKQHLHFKYLFTPLGNLINEWATVFLFFLPLPIILFFVHQNFRYRWLFLLNIILFLTVLIISFCRGIYLALCTFIIMVIILLIKNQMINWRKLVIVSSLLGLLVILFLFPVRESLVTTSLGFKTLSQVRSIEGRITIWKNSIKIFRQNPILGVGSFNFPIYYTAYKNNDTVSPFIGRAFNTYLQIIVEKGLLGFITFFIIIYISLHHTKNKLKNQNITKDEKYISILLVSMIISVLVRDFTYSSLIYHDGVGLLFWLYLALINQE